jgi:hypothetical protein
VANKVKTSRRMKKRNFIKLFAVLLVTMAIIPGKLQSQDIPNWKIDPDKELNPNTKWLREAKWGMFTHYTIYPPNHRIPGMCH